MKEILEWIEAKLRELLVAPPVPRGGFGASGSLELGSLYDVEGERKVNAESLGLLGMDLISDPELLSHDITGDSIPETFCNRAAQRAANAFGCHDLDGLSANGQTLALMGLPDGWQGADGARAIRHAQRGGLAFAAKQYSKHGHIALVAPLPGEESGSWGKAVPMLYNVGKTNGIMKTSKAFPVDLGEPAYFVYGETA